MALHWLGMMLAALALIGCGYQLFAAIALKRFFARPPARPATAEAMTILKPLHGDEPQLGVNLESYLAQDYSAPVQMVCGVSDPNVARTRFDAESLRELADSQQLDASS